MVLLVGVMLEVDIDIIKLPLAAGVAGSLCLYYATDSISFSFLIVSRECCEVTQTMNALTFFSLSFCLSFCIVADL
jgi:hypothetical protein